MARRKTAPTAKTWAIRAGVGLAAGVLLGFALGAVTVRVMQPPVVTAPDSGQTAARKPTAGKKTADNEPVETESSAPVNGIRVPQLIGMEEGDARKAILRSGFAIGSVTFKASDEPLGRVVESIPVPGEAVVLPAMVSLILSDGKGRPDSLSLSPLR